MGRETDAAGSTALIRVLVAEDEEPLRAAICDLIGAEEGFEVVAVASDAKTAIVQARATRPDVALLDTRMPGGGGARVVAELRTISPETRAVALSAYDQRPDVLEMLGAGALGYVVKGEQPEEILDAIRRATRGQSSFSAAVEAELVSVAGAGSGSEPHAGGELRFGELLESAPDAVAITDEQGRIVLVNLEAERLFGYAREELLGSPIEILLPERHHERHVRARTDYVLHPVRRPMNTGIELTARRKDGTEVPVDISLSTTDTDEGRLVTAFIRDLTERKAKEELEHRAARRQEALAYLVGATEKERQRIAEDIHDDTIQVMTAALMRLQIFSKRLDDPEQRRKLEELEESIRLAIARLRRLLFELLPPALERQGLATALGLYLEETGRDSTTSYRLDDRLTSEPGREIRLVVYRIAQEALANVARHAAATQATVRLSERDGGYLVRVEDDGVGFEPGSLESQPGHLGLSTLRERAELAGGWLRIDSLPGEGTTVEFWIPAEIGRSGPPGER